MKTPKQTPGIVRQPAGLTSPKGGVQAATVGDELCRSFPETCGLARG